MRAIFLFAFVVLAAYSCMDNAEKPRVEYSEDAIKPITMDEVMSDTTKTIVATLPVYFDSTTVLLQPSGLINIKEIKDMSVLGRLSYPIESKSYREKTKDSDFHLGAIYADQLSGQISNIYFDDLTNNVQRLLTEDYISISQVVYLREIAKKTGRDYLIYFVYDRDTNRDGKLNSGDILTLYMSNLDGSGFVKISKDNHQLADYKLVVIANRYYFTTIEDVNRDGYFNKGDKYNYYYIDFSQESYEIVEYNPVNR
ncbi:MAG TPA: hypothetical protein DIT04_03660 [Dysgonomonas sp.]|nr:hypothetical protein [Dysgonomonas sp.]